jgi:hypothetical protein
MLTGARHRLSRGALLSDDVDDVVTVHRASAAVRERVGRRRRGCRDASTVKLSTKVTYVLGGGRRRPRGADDGVLKGGAAPETAAYDVVLVATGRRPYTAGLGLAELGVKQDKFGRVVVEPRSCRRAACRALKRDRASQLLAGMKQHVRSLASG